MNDYQNVKVSEFNAFVSKEECSLLEGRLESVRLDKSYKTVPGHEEVDALLGMIEDGFIRRFDVACYFSTGLVINIDLEKHHRKQLL